jgi:hypothetical protein
MDIKPEFERCRCEQMDGVRSVGSGVERRPSGKGKYVASRQVGVEGIGRGVDGKGIQFVGERFSRPVEVAEVAVIETTGGALRENEMRLLDGVFPEEMELSET